MMLVSEQKTGEEVHVENWTLVLAAVFGMPPKSAISSHATHKYHTWMLINLPTNWMFREYI